MISQSFDSDIHRFLRLIVELQKRYDSSHPNSSKPDDEW
jgi:hypothetical protein